MIPSSKSNNNWDSKSDASGATGSAADAAFQQDYLIEILKLFNDNAGVIDLQLLERASDLIINIVTAPVAAQHMELTHAFVVGLEELGFKEKEIDLIYNVKSDSVDEIMARVRDVLKSFLKKHMDE